MKKTGTSWFYKILLLYLVTVLFTSCVLTVFSYEQFSESLMEKAYADYQAGLRKNARTWNDLVSEIGQLSSAIAVDPQSENFFSMEEYDPVQEYNTYLKVKKLFNINPFMEAFCLYNPDVECALYCGTDALPLEIMWEELREKNGKVVMRTKRTDNEEPLLVFGYPVYMDSFEGPQGAVFLALHAQKVTEHVLGGIDYPQLLLGEGGELLLESGDAKESEAVVAWAGQQAGDFRNETLSFSQSRYLCSFYKEEGITQVSYVEYGEVMGALGTQRNIFLLVCVVVMALSACVQFVIVKRLYRPIASLKEEFSNSRFADGTAKEEFELIRQVYEGAVSHVEKLEEKNAAYLPRIRADILRNLVTGNLDPVQADVRLREHGWEIPFSGMFIVSVQIEKNPEDEPLINVVQAKMKQLLTQRLEGLFYVECVTQGSDEVIGLINTRAGEEATFENLVEGLICCRDKLLSEYDISLTVGLDGVVEGIKDCSRVYGKVRQLMKNRFALGENQVIYPARVMELLPEPLSWPDKLMQEVLLAYTKAQREEFLQKAQDFLDTICRYEYTSASFMFARLYLEMAARRQAHGVKGRIPAMEMKADPATKEEALGLLTKAFDSYVDCRREAEQVKGNKHYKKIMEGRQFILDNYADCTLGVDMVAERLGYSSNYFARLFRSITGYYVNDFIRQVRIMKAQELLQGTDKTVNEIAEATGFTTPNYFYSIFKKETGMTPAAYRSSAEEG